MSGEIESRNLFTAMICLYTK